MGNEQSDTRATSNTMSEQLSDLIMQGSEDDLAIFIEELLKEDESTLNNFFNSKNGIASCHLAALLGRTGIICILLERGLNINCVDGDGNTMLNSAARFGSGVLADKLVQKGIDINSKNDDDETALHTAAKYGQDHIVLLLVKNGIDIADDMNAYAPDEDEGNINYRKFNTIPKHYYLNSTDSEEEGGPIVFFQDCRPTIFTELEERRKKTLFETFVNHHIEYPPYIILIYSNLNSIKSWERAAALRDKYYFDEVFFYLHLHVANSSNANSSNSLPTVIMTKSSMEMNSANNSNRTATLMTILTKKLKLMLLPDQSLVVNVPFVLKDDDIIGNEL